MKTMRRITPVVLFLAVLMSVAGGCHRKKGGGYLQPTPLQSPPSHVR